MAELQDLPSTGDRRGRRFHLPPSAHSVYTVVSISEG
jgi:hypothetical protein